MNGSLKALIPPFAKLLGMTPAALYERQRALVRAGLLEVEEGRGPGSGVRATPESVALILTAVLATDRLSETERRTRQIAKASSDLPRKGPAIPDLRCEFTGEKRFIDAFEKIVMFKHLTDKVREIRVSRNYSYARIEYAAGQWNDLRGTNFGAMPPRFGLRAEAVLGHDAVAAAAECWRKIEGKHE